MPPPSTLAKPTPWEIQRSVVFALFVRELNARFGRFRLGYLWALLEPLFVVVVLSFIRGRFTGADLAGVPPALFFASGILAYFLFRNIVNVSLAAVESNLGLFNYQRVKPADVVIARALLELLITLGCAALILPGFYLFGQTFAFNSMLQLFAVLACLLLFSLGVGLVCVIIGPLWNESRKVVPMIIRPLFFISGIFFPANAIPPAIRDIALLNPLLHAIELLRSALFVGHSSHEGSWAFLVGCTLASFVLGLALYRVFRVTVLTSGNIR